MEEERTYICIDLKSYYASVECVYRGLDPLRTNLLVADPSRSDQTICLAVSPSLKAIGVPSRPRLFEAKQRIREYEIMHHTQVRYIIAVPRMAEYERISAQIYGIYLRYAAAEDIHVYSIDECFVDCTPYLHLYQKQAEQTGTHPAHVMAMTMIRDVLRTTGITATVGIGTNLYLAKVAMDIVAKKSPADRDGVRIAELNEDSYKFLLWEHRPLTDFWQIGPGKARRLYRSSMFTMGDIAQRSQWDEEYFYKTFGIDGEILIDHAWGIEPVTMQDIKNYRSTGHSLSNGQVLPRPYPYPEARLVFREMIEVLCSDLFAKNLVTRSCSWWVSYDHKSLEVCPNYEGPVTLDFYGRLHPKHTGGVVRYHTFTASLPEIEASLVKQFDARTDHRLLFRKLGVCAGDVSQDMGIYQLDLFTDYDARERDRRLMQVMLEVRRKYGPNAVFKGINLLEGATTLERNQQIGGHRA
ncbi:MAG: DNA methylase [Lachnospiraceae bacterium]|nr:DNA methylase [Lachnospiraceae bacterium]